MDKEEEDTVLYKEGEIYLGIYGMKDRSTFSNHGIDCISLGLCGGINTPSVHILRS